MTSNRYTTSLLQKLEFIYGKNKAKTLLQDIDRLVDSYADANRKSNNRWVSEQDVMLITYGDSMQSSGESPLQTLRKFVQRYCDGLFSSMHILPFYPYTSDDGFSVTNYREVNPKLGDWTDIADLAVHVDLMFDGVINHISQHSHWFQQYLAGNPEYADYFVEADPAEDYSQVTRPRALPLLTKFDTALGEKHIWTTFSDDQIDLNYASERVLLEILDILLMYVVRGARYLRLDAIGFMWKKLGTTCMHLDETHAIVQVIREVLETFAPGTIIITETNVPHKDNIKYFGNGSNEAHMVYQFPLPPLTLHTLHTGNSDKLMEWLQSLEPTTDSTAFFNFLASHDGVGVRPVEGILSKQEVNAMVDKVHEHGGFVSYKDNGDGTRSPYELNINYLEALSHPDDSIEMKVKRFRAASAILLSVMGMPAIYIHSLLGSRNDTEGVKKTGRYRSINREQLRYEQVESELQQEGSLRNEVYSSLAELIKFRIGEPCFHPNAAQRVVVCDNRLFTIIRTSAEGGEVLALVNVADESVSVPCSQLQTGWKEGEAAVDLVGAETFKWSDSLQLCVQPYQVMWIKQLKGGDDA
ncbi:sugar phosphorylase [Paenibacillus apiarius]|uniref:sugar phosphorylase n=1 Tax=Paenibacillus apiarius TaxID=46240 RepID=UPI001980093A|nr:sugar phosphorylase [Paenibacillus apiarius]MBN3525101.1 sugar phosphorylase [Paenibacillus apiarius]